MIRKLYAAPTTEPITLAQTKAHLRLESISFLTDFTLTRSVDLGVYTPGTQTGASVEVLGLRALVLLESAVCTGASTLDVHIEDSPDNVTWTDVPSGAFTQVTAATHGVTSELEYTGVQRYLRAIAVVGGGANSSFGVSILTDTVYAHDEAKVELLITTARQYMEETLGRAFITQTWELVLDDFPTEKYIELPLPPLASVTSITYYDVDDVPAIQAATEYYVDTYSEPGRIVLNDGESWPTTSLRPANGVIIRYICGGTAASVPEPLCNAMMMLVGHLYENRELVVTTGAVPKELPLAYKHLVAPYQIWSF